MRGDPRIVGTQAAGLSEGFERGGVVPFLQMSHPLLKTNVYEEVLFDLGARLFEREGGGGGGGQAGKEEFLRNRERILQRSRRRRLTVGEADFLGGVRSHLLLSLRPLRILLQRGSIVGMDVRRGLSFHRHLRVIDGGLRQWLSLHRLRTLLERLGEGRWACFAFSPLPLRRGFLPLDPLLGFRVAFQDRRSLHRFHVVLQLLEIERVSFLAAGHLKRRGRGHDGLRLVPIRQGGLPFVTFAHGSLLSPGREAFEQFRREGAQVLLAPFLLRKGLIGARQSFEDRIRLLPDLGGGGHVGVVVPKLPGKAVIGDLEVEVFTLRRNFEDLEVVLPVERLVERFDHSGIGLRIGRGERKGIGRRGLLPSSQGQRR